MRKGPVCDYHKWNVSLVICNYYQETSTLYVNYILTQGEYHKDIIQNIAGKY